MAATAEITISPSQYWGAPFISYRITPTCCAQPYDVAVRRQVTPEQLLAAMGPTAKCPPCARQGLHAALKQAAMNRALKGLPNPADRTNIIFGSRRRRTPGR